MFKYEHDGTTKSAVPRYKRGSAVGEFVSTLLRRIDHTRRAIDAAREAELPYEVELHHATLAALLRTADEHAIPVPEQIGHLEHR